MSLTLAVTAVILVAVFGAMARGWRNRARRFADLAAPAQVPADWEPEGERVPALYEATCVGGAPLDRVNVHGLGYRKRVQLELGAAGIAIRGADRIDWFIPREALSWAHPSDWTIDKGIERDGLVAIEWRLGDAPLTTYLRTDSGTAQAQLLNHIGTSNARKASAHE